MPVRNSSTVSPSTAGFAAFTSEKSACNTAPVPLPDWSSANIAGAVAATGTVTELEFAPLFCTTIVAVDPVSEYGTTQLICAALTNSIPHGLLLIIRLTPFSEVGYGGEAC